MNGWIDGLFVCLGFYAVSTVFQLFNGDSSQIHASWTISDQSIILTLVGQSWCYSHNPERKGGKATTTSFTGLSWPGLKPMTSRLQGGRSNY